MANEMTIHTPSVYGSGVTPFMTRYALTYPDVRTVLYDLNDNSITSAFSQLYSDKIDNIVALYHYPFDVINKLYPRTGTGYVNIEVSTAHLNAKGIRIDDRVPYQVAEPLSLGQIGITPLYHSFLDYAPYTKIDIYLPFIGFETLDTDLVMGNTIKLRYIVDTYTGKCTAYVILIRDGVESVIMTRDGQCGVPIQICGGNGAELARNMLRFGINTIAGGVGAVGAVRGAATTLGAVSAGAGFLASSTVGALDASHVGVHKGSQQTALTSGYGPLMAYLIYTRPKVAEPTSYAHTYGRPCGKALTLNTLTGFTQVDAVHVEGAGFENATTPERDEIERLLKTGVLL